MAPEVSGFTLALSPTHRCRDVLLIVWQGQAERCSTPNSSLQRRAATPGLLPRIPKPTFEHPRRRHRSICPSLVASMVTASQAREGSHISFYLVAPVHCRNLEHHI